MSKKFDPSEILSDLTKDTSSSHALELVDESGISTAPNFLEFAISPKYLNTRILPRQIQAGAHMFADFCPDCSNPGYIDTLFDQSIGNIKANVVFLNNGVCPKCKKTRFELVREKKLNQYNEFIGCLGQRSGKTKFTGILSAYTLHKLLVLPNPLRKFNLPNGEMLLGTFAALTLDQAKDTIWDSFKGFVESSPWYKQYHEFLKAEGKRLGVELFKENITSLVYKHKHINIHCTGSQDRKMRGRTRFLAAIDELGWFISDDTKKDLQNMNADAVYTALSNSLATMRMKFQQTWGPKEYDLPTALMCNISSPSAAKDKIMRLLKQANNNNKMYALNLPTWEANPDYSEEVLRNEYSSMEEADFMRDFGAEPPLTSDPYISEPRAIDRICTGIHSDNILPHYTTYVDGRGDEYKIAEANILRNDKRIRRLITLDLGTVKNALALCLFHLNAEGKIVLELVVNVRPEKNKPINTAIFFDNFVMRLVDRLDIKYAFFDRWQSLDQVHRLRDKGVDAQMYSLTYKDMDSVRGSILSSSLVLPKLDIPMAQHVEKYVERESYYPEPVALLGIQLLTVRDLRHKMAKPLVGDDDIFRAFCLGVTKLCEPKIKKTMSEVSLTQSGHAIKALGVIRSRSRSSMGSGKMSNHLGALRTRRAEQ